MTIYRAQFTLQHVSNTSELACVNTWYVDTVGGNDAVSLQEAFDDISPFYEAIQSLLSATYLSGEIDTKWYRLSDPEPRVPALEEGFIINPGVGVGCLPPEVALCVSYRASFIAGTPRARRRGRFYVGPFDTEALDGASGRPTAATVNALMNAAGDVLVRSDADATWTWMQYSQVAQLAAPVIGGWVDDEWDTQRRRGRDRTFRVPFGAGPG